MSTQMLPSRHPTFGEPVRIIRDLASPMLSSSAAINVLALGGEVKSTLCSLRGKTAWISEPFGNLTNPKNYRAFVAAFHHVERLLGKADVVAHDGHPLFTSTSFARTLGRPAVTVQHHHAHIASVMAEHGVTADTIGVCCDGVGWGTDGAAWGCELLYCNDGRFERMGHLDYLPLFGADAAAVETWRPAAALLRQAFKSKWRQYAPMTFDLIPDDKLNMFDAAVERGINAPPTSSLGRVFDGVSCLLGLCNFNHSEAEAAIALECACEDTKVEPYPYQTTIESGSILMSVAPTIRAIVFDMQKKTPVVRIATRFHETIARMLTASAFLACELRNTDTVAISGGCFANKRLTALVEEYLSRRRLTVLKNHAVSCGDAGLSLGQAVVADLLWKERK